MKKPGEWWTATIIAVLLLAWEIPTVCSEEPIRSGFRVDPTSQSAIQEQMFDDRDFARARPHILPQLAPKVIFSKAQRQAMLCTDFLNDLVLYYVIDHPEVKIPEGQYGAGRRIHRFILQSDLSQWHVDEVEVFQAAMENINAHERNQTYQELESGPGKIFSVNTDDGFAAARLLSIGMMGMWVKEVGEDLVIAVPTKEFLYATPVSNEAGIEYLQKLTDEQFRTLERPLTKKLFVFHVEDGTLSTFLDRESTHRQGKRYLFLPKGPVHGGPIEAESRVGKAGQQ